MIEAFFMRFYPDMKHYPLSTLKLSLTARAKK